VWTGNFTCQPAFKSVDFGAPAAGLPNADRVREQGLVLPSNHSLSDEDIDYIWSTAEGFLA
jgi:dTDP-4-amino-4,6-dideoxygalactose transaminase